MTPSNRAAVIAGAGMLPVYWAREATARGLAVAVAAVSEAAEEEQLKQQARSYIKTGAGRLEEMIGFIKASGISRAVFLGKVGWEDLFRGEGPDQRLKNVLESIKNSRNACSFFAALAEELHSEGIDLLDQTLFMEDYLAGDGILTPGVEISGRVLKDMEFAFEIAKKVSSLGIGQAVVAKDGAVVAVEAVEGTDSTIIRSGGLASGGVVAKVMAAGHDARFDVPTIGPDTISSMIRAGSAALVLEAGRTFILRRDEVVKLAGDHGIAIVGKRCANA